MITGRVAAMKAIVAAWPTADSVRILLPLVLLAALSVAAPAPEALCRVSRAGDGKRLSPPLSSPDTTSRALADLRFGFKAGASFAQHAGTEERDAEYQVTSRWRTSYAAGAFLRFPVTSRLGMQQELVYARKGSRQDIGVEILDIPTVLDLTYDMDYLEIAALFRFAWLKWNHREVYSLAGTALCLKVHDRYVLKGEVSDGEQVVPLSADADMSEVDMFDYALVYGTGLELSAAGRRVFLEYRFTIGWNTLAMPTYAYVPLGEERVLIENEPVPLKNQNHLILVGICL
jgi:hypothetical protein